MFATVLPAAAAALLLNGQEPRLPAAVPPGLAPAAEGAEITVLTYNIRGLPWPIATGRAHALREIGRELAAMRVQGRQPTIVLIQEGFRSEVAGLVKASGYRYWARGPARGERPDDPKLQDGPHFRHVRYVATGEGWGKFTSGGLHVLSDLPIVDIRSTAYRYCAGWDCLANKGAMLVTVRLPGAGVDLDVVNTHMNSKGASRVPRQRSSQAHNLQTDEFNRFVNANRGGRPMLIGGDFNVKGAPERYYYKADNRSYTVVSEYCSRPQSRCDDEAGAKTPQPWLKSQDLQAFESGGPVEIQPTQVEKVFSSPQSGGRLSDHDGYLVRYRLSWRISPSAGTTGAQTLAQVDP